AVVALLFLGHVAASSWRMRNHWLVLDLLLGAATLGVLVMTLRGLALLAVGPVVFQLAPGVIAVSLVVAALASLVQLTVGRADPQRGQAALSLSFWSLTAVALCAMLAWTASLHHVKPAQVGGAGFPVFRGSGPALVIGSG